MDMDHSSMSSDSGSSSSTMSSMSSMTHSMSMVFTTDHSTALYASAWTPRTTGAYAGTCIFLIVLGIISRLLLAFRQVLEAKWHDKAVNRRYVVAAGEAGQLDNNNNNNNNNATSPTAAADEKSDYATLTTRGLDENVRVLRTPRQHTSLPAWRFSTDLPRACIFTVQAFVGYLL